MFNMYFRSRIVLIDTCFNCLGNTSGHCITSTRTGRILQRYPSFYICYYNISCCKHSIQFFKRDHKVNITPTENIDLCRLFPLQPVYEGYGIPEELLQIPLFQDSMRRDITMNALYFDPYSRNLYDFHGGLRDIRDGVINSIFMPDIQFSYNPGSELRAIRFAAKYRFFTQEDVEIALRVNGRKNISAFEPHLVYKDTVKMFGTGYAERCFELMQRYRITPVIIPSLARSENRIAYELYLDRLSSYLQNLTKADLGGKIPYRAFIYSSLYYPRFIEFLKEGLSPEGAADRTLDEALTFMELDEETVKSLKACLLRFYQPDWDTPNAAHFQTIHAMGVRVLGR